MSTVADKTFPRQAAADELSFRLQRGFRTLLDAMARPGELCELDALAPDAVAEGRRLGLFAQTMSLCDVLLDGQTSLAVAGDDGETRACELSRRTHVHVRGFGQASFAIIPLGATAEQAAGAVAALTSGTLVSPHMGATCLVECATLIGTDRDGVRSGSSSGSDAPRIWELSGPGIKDTARIACDRAAVIDAAVARQDEFPCGIDLVLLDAAGHLAAIPRSTKVVALDESVEVDAWAM
jgi:alpha-D-ribose 1-methylphosphonate 5-triphosphate synthase subunit PhnH